MSNAVGNAGQERLRRMYVWRVPAWLLVLLLAPHAQAQLIEGLDTYTDAVIGLSTTKWTGPRVPAPVPQARPPEREWLASADWPVRVHGSARLESTLRAAEHAYTQLFAAGFLTSFGPRDLYLVDHDGAEADATGNFSALDGVRAFALVDARTPHLEACVAQALMEAQLLELDPAEDVALRRGVAAYYAWLVSGDSCADELAPTYESPFATVASAQAWLTRLSARQDRNRGTFLFDMWQLARQRTWEGQDLRASPDLLEAIAKALSLAHESFDLVAGELAEASTPERTVSFEQLPMFSRGRALAVLGSTRVRVELGVPRPGTRLRAWCRAEAGRYTLSAQRLDASGRVSSRLELPPRTDGQLSIELDAQTVAVNVTLTRVADVGLPDPDAPDLERREAGLTIDAR